MKRMLLMFAFLFVCATSWAWTDAQLAQIVNRDVVVRDKFGEKYAGLVIAVTADDEPTRKTTSVETREQYKTATRTERKSAEEKTPRTYIVLRSGKIVTTIDADSVVAIAAKNW